MLASDDTARRPRSDTPCRFCGTAWPSCDSLHWLRAITCCPSCRGDHEEATDAAS